MIQTNQRAWELFNLADLAAAELGWEAHQPSCGTRVIDAGIHAPAGLQAGLRMAEISTADLARARLSLRSLGATPWPHVEIYSDHPLLGCFLCQSANWSIDLPGFRGMGSGPACLLANPQIGQAFGHQEEPDYAILVIETDTLPDESACQALAQGCGVPSECLGVLVAPTSSLAGSAQIAARSIETALHKLHHLGFDLRRIVSATGLCPLAPPTGDNWLSLGKTNDAMTFGSQVWLAVNGVRDSQLESQVQQIPACASPAYGRTFLEILAEANDFYAVDPGIFAPAEVVVTNLDTGSSFHAGARDEPRLVQALRGSC